jgi:hypothetical protein
MRLDHVAYAASHDQLADVVNRIGSALGVGLQDGGRHPRFGTHNFVLPLADGAYVEVVAALDHPAADRAPFGRAVRRRADEGGGWLGWVVAVDDITDVENRLGRAAVDGNRHRPDGVELHWRQIGVQDLLDDPQLPFFVQWQVPPEDHPAAGARDGLRIVAMEIAGDPEKVAAHLGSTPDAPVEGVTITWVEADQPGLQAVVFATPRGEVHID